MTTWQIMIKCILCCSMQSLTHWSRSNSRILAAQKTFSSPPSSKLRKSISPQRSEKAAMPHRQKCGVDNPKRRGEAPPFWSLGVQGRSRNAPAVLLGDSKGAFSHARECPFYTAASEAMPPPAGSLSPWERHTRATECARLIPVTKRRRFMAKPCTPHLHSAGCAVLRAKDCQCAGSRGKAPRLSLGGFKGGYSLRKESIPL